MSDNRILEEEREANRFAIELLMPRSFLEKEPLLQREVICIDESPVIKELADKYQVSEQLMLLRLVDLEMIRI